MNKRLSFVFFMLFGLYFENIVASEHGTLGQRQSLGTTCDGMRKNINEEFLLKFSRTHEAQTEDGQKLIELANQRIEKLGDMIYALQSIDAPLFNRLRSEYNDMAKETQQLEKSFKFFEQFNNKK